MENITFILGAGASKKYGIYAQSELPERIYTECGPNTTFEKVFMEMNIDLSVSNQMRSNMFNCTDSIDEWLSNHPEYETLGKTMIAAILLSCETDIPVRNSENWYRVLFDNYLNQRKLEDFGENASRFNFITFNYDRSLEYFLTKVLTNKFSNKPNDVVQQLKSLNIVHVYGKFGEIEPGKNYIPYGKINELKRKSAAQFQPSHLIGYLKIARSNIQLMYGDKLTPGFEKAREIISNSDKIYFMGFGYHEDNMNKLGAGSSVFEGKTIKGTGWKYDKRRIDTVSRNTKGLLNKDNLIDKTCYEFIDYIYDDIIG